MREIEVLVKCDNSKDEIIEKVKNFKFINEKRVIDTYYYDELRDALKPDNKLRLNECFRIRDKNGETYLTYKIDKFNGDIWLYSDEFETKVENKEQLENIIKKLGLKELIIIDNTKITYETDDYYIFVEDVKNLGIFLEVELKNDRDDDVEVLKDEIREFINSLNLKNVIESNEGKPEMMLKTINK